VPRSDSPITIDPFRTWIITVDQYNRIRLPLDVGDVVSWVNVKPGKIECIGTPGPAGGVQLVPRMEHEHDGRRLAKAMGGAPPSASESSQRWVDLARLLATAWIIPVNVEANRLSITLPEQPRRAQQLPQAGAAGLVFGFGEILEIWDAIKWHDHVRTTAKRKVAAISEALEDLEQR
jgi:hypothetical protein